ncbi:MAG: imidazole glycerol phosphate synthase subunit HisH [Bdellovibrio sp.]
MSKVTIIDYGVGNLLNVVRAFKAIGVDAEIISDPTYIKTADRVVLPGVGAFADGISELKKRGFIDEIKNYVGTGNPFLGICLGMQLLLDESEEFGPTQGLGIISGKVVKIPEVGTDGSTHKVPHIGWSHLIQGKNNGSGILTDISEASSVYFVHSYMVQPTDESIVTSSVDYNGISIPATLQVGHIHAAQFHPERSAEVGLKILKNFSLL